MVLFGSWARDELTPGSDDDWAVLLAAPAAVPPAAVAEALNVARAELGGEGRQPGAQGVFGSAFDVEGLIRHVGLDADSNTNLTRRMLLLLESVELAGSTHDQGWQAVLDRYLRHGAKDYRPPRFLLNDLVRYWRTMCVDFEGKHATAGTADPKWLMRNAKLRTSRKLLFAGGLVPILLCRLKSRDEVGAFLSGWLTAPPVDRVAEAFLHLERPDVGARTLGAYDRWIGLMQEPGAREALRAMEPEERDASPLWQEIRGIGDDLQRGLLSLLLDTPLRPIATQYAIF